MLENTTKYELAYHLLPDLEEAEVAKKVSEIETIITQNKGLVVHSVQPQRKHLSYPIDHKHYANFGVLEFQAPTEAITKINAQMKLESEVMRYLLVQSFSDQKVLKSLTPSKRHSRTKTEGGPKTEKKEEVPAGTMEKQLEDVIEKI